MTIRHTFPLEAEASLSTVSFSKVRTAIIGMAQEHNLPVSMNSDSGVIVEIPSFGQYGFKAQGAGISIRISAALRDRLHMLKEGFAEHLEQLQPGAANDLYWSDAGDKGALPPNVQFTTVQSVTPVAETYLRIRVQAQDLSSFQEDAIHFRLLLPPGGCADPEWPSLSETGASVWPKGEKALHRPVYTVRTIDHDANTMEFDIFLHDGGRATEWARKAQPGDQLAIAGPGGGGIPVASDILLYADETALPAVARILETLPQETRGQATLMTDTGNCGYPVTAPEGVAVTWIRRDDAKGLATRALIARQDHPDHYFWFACEKSDVQQVREALKDNKPAPGQSYIAAYWSQS